jgi:16S rRNA C1402 (ribose-2'-O) methylase RsmI
VVSADIIACEDTRKTAKFIQLMQNKKLKNKFKMQFGATFDDFVENDLFDQQTINESMEKLKKEEGGKGMEATEHDSTAS